MTALATRPTADVRRDGDASPRPFPGVLFAVVLLVVVGRGAIQLVTGQSAAYVVQVVAVAVFVGAVVLRAGPSRRARSGMARFSLAVFLVVAVVSAAASLWLNDNELGLVLAGVMAFVAVLLTGAATADFSWSKMSRAGTALVIVVWVQVLVAGAQQILGDQTFPGGSRVGGELIRPPALTGSYLHYPIELALLSLALLGMFAASKRWSHLVTGLVGMGAVILSQGRSGMVIVLFGLALGTLFLRSIGGRLKTVMAAVLAVVLLIVLFPENSFVARFLSIGVVEGSVNELRVNTWLTVLETWSRGPLLIGDRTGEFTNVTDRLTDVDRTAVPESGVLSMLVNFGVLGLLAFYGLMIAAARSAPRRSWYQAALLAGIVQSFFYQSIEVLPFMVIFAMIPVIGRAFDADVTRLPEPHDRHGRTGTAAVSP